MQKSAIIAFGYIFRRLLQTPFQSMFVALIAMFDIVHEIWTAKGAGVVFNVGNLYKSGGLKPITFVGIVAIKNVDGDIFSHTGFVPYAGVIPIIIVGASICICFSTCWKACLMVVFCPSLL